MNSKTSDILDHDHANSAAVLPSEFMRNLRPEYYSDSETATKIELAADEFEYRLDTITARNETHDFELFCRKLCEQAICPDLRAQTGPEGGGDAKVDSETLPVAEEIRERYYQGIANQGQEYWAVAISAQEKWYEKVRRDVKSIVETKRGYERIYFITSRHARAKDRARIEQELKDRFGATIIIHDRTWIVEETIDKERKELALNFLKVGRETESAMQLGPNDYSRSRQLEAIDNEIKNPDSFAGMEMQLAAEALVAAKLSRNLERPQTETEGRFLQAIRLAEKYGTNRQKFEAKYEQLWSAFWYFNEFDFFFSEYSVFEERALQSKNAVDLEWLGNLHQCLVNSVVHGFGGAEQIRLDERTNTLEAKLEELASLADRPNNQLEAKAGLLRVKLNRAMLANDHKALPGIWGAYSDIVEASKGLGEFNFDSLIKFIEMTGQVAGNDPAYNALVEKTAEVVSDRKSESEAAQIYLNRAKKMSLDDKFELIGWLGKAAIGLVKQERSRDLVEAMYLLANAYCSAGLLWAARSSCGLAIATLFIEGDRDNEVPVTVVPFMKLSALISIELRHLPDALHQIQLLRGFSSGLPLDDESKNRVQRDLQELDIMLGGMLLNTDDTDIALLEYLPDLFAALDVFMARTSLMYSLGHFEALREDGSLPENESDEEILDLLNQIKCRFSGIGDYLPLVTNRDAPTILETIVLGMRVTVEFDGSVFISLAEAILGAIEAFFATSIIHGVTAHTEHYRIVLTAGDAGTSPVTETLEFDKTTTVQWPSDLTVGGLDQERDVRRHLTEIAGHVFGATCFASDAETALDRIMGHDAGAHRISMVVSYPNSHNRMFRKAFSELNDWDERALRRFEFRNERVPMPVSEAPNLRDSKPSGGDAAIPAPKSHRQLRVRSVIDVQTWNAASWKGCGYFHPGHDLPPIMIFLFEDEESGRRVFEGWQDRFGAVDRAEEIGISIIRNIDGWNPHHYLVQITSNVPENSGDHIEKIATRSLQMTPTNSENINLFKRGYDKFGRYAIIPGLIPQHPAGEPALFFDLAIEKQAISVQEAADVSEHELNGLSLKIHHPQSSGS